MSERIAVDGGLVVELYRLQGTDRWVADVWLESEEAATLFYERRRIDGRLYGRVGTRRHGPNKDEAARVLQGENALAFTAIRQAGLHGRINGGRAFL